MTKSETTTSVATLLHQAAETHHSVFAISNGEDSDWATWYSDWLVNLSALPPLLGGEPGIGKSRLLDEFPSHEFPSRKRGSRCCAAVRPAAKGCRRIFRSSRRSVTTAQRSASGPCVRLSEPRVPFWPASCRDLR